jgi:hypothetical protein
MAWVSAAAVIGVVFVVLMFFLDHRKERDLGSVSDQWMVEHRHIDEPVTPLIRAGLRCQPSAFLALDGFCARVLMFLADALFPSPASVLRMSTLLGLRPGLT